MDELLGGDNAQKERFIETARELGADQDADALDRVFGKVVPPVLPDAPKTPKGDG